MSICRKMRQEKKLARDDEESLLCIKCGKCCQPNDYCCLVSPGRQVLHDELIKLVDRIKCEVINPELAFKHLQALTASRVVGPEITTEHIRMLKAASPKKSRNVSFLGTIFESNAVVSTTSTVIAATSKKG